MEGGRKGEGWRGGGKVRDGGGEGKVRDGGGRGRPGGKQATRELTGVIVYITQVYS